MGYLQILLGQNEVCQKWQNLYSREGIKPGTNARDPGSKSGTKFCQPNMGTKHACIKLKFMSNVDYRHFL